MHLDAAPDMGLEQFRRSARLNTGTVFLTLLPLACAWSCGLGLFKTMVALALLHRYAPGGGLPGAMGLMGQAPWFWGIACLAALEVIVDIWPGMDVRWNRATGLLRVAGAAILAFMSASGDGMALQATWAVLGASVALFTYGVHAGARRAAQEAGTNVFVSPVTSVTETCMIFAILLPLSAMPVLSGLMLGFTALAGCLVLYLIFPSVKAAYAQMLFAPGR